MEDAAARQADRVLICDTPAFATSLWHERYLGRLSPEVEAIAASYRYELYLLTDVDIPFVQDGTRDGEHIRHGMHRRFVEWLTAHGHPSRSSPALLKNACGWRRTWWTPCGDDRPIDKEAFGR